MNDDLTGRRLGDSLREHVPAQAHAPLGLADVKGAAGRIQRRRRVAGFAAAAVAAAVITPVAFLTWSGNDQTAPPIAPATQTPAQTPATQTPATQTPTPVGPRDDITLSPLAPRGTAADGWFTPGIDNAEIPPEAMPDDPDRVARLGDRWLISFFDEEKEERLLRLVTADGSVVQEFVQSTDFAIADDHDLVAFTTPEGQLRLLDDAGNSRVFAVLPDEASVASPIDVTGSAGCVDESETDGCQVLLDHVDGQGPVMVTEGGELSQIDPRAEAADAINGSVVALRDRNAPGADAPCTRVVELTGKQLWKSCDFVVEAFSPDGRYAQVIDAQQSGWGPSRAGVADAATGELLFWINPAGKDSGVSRAVWEGSDHLVLSTFNFRAQQWRLFRVSTRGDVEQVAEPVEDDDMAFPFIPPAMP